MRFVLLLALAGFLTAGSVAGVPGQPGTSGPQDPFRSGVDLVHVDVSVFDDARQPVRGLTAEDFTVLEVGKPQRILTFVPVEVPPPPSSITATWLREVGPDVVTNERDVRRLVVIAMDDATTAFDRGEALAARKVGRAIVDELGPTDLAAVVFTFMGRTQNFTADRRALLAAINSFTPRNATEGPPVGGPAGFAGPVAPGAPLGCRMKLGGCVVSALREVGLFLEGAPPGRKILMFLGSAPRLNINSDPFNQLTPVTDMFRALQTANVTVNTFNLSGLTTLASVAGDRSLGDAHLRIGGNRQSSEDLRTLAELTGGQAFTDANDPDTFVPDVFRQDRSYYLLGFQSTDAKADNRFRRIEVKVRRPGVVVRTRSGYYATRKKDDRRTSQPDVEVALANGHPARDVPLRLSVATFAVPGRREADILLTAGLELDSGAAGDRVSIVGAAFDASWKQRDRYQQSFEMPVVPGAPAAPLDVHARLRLRPGRYEIRVAVERNGRAGSVLSNVDVPDYAGDGVSLSSVVLVRQPAVFVRNGVFPDVLPLPPTTDRVFERSDRLAAFVRVYQGGRKALAPVQVVSRIVSDRDLGVFEATSMVDPARFTAARAADHSLELPVAKLTPGGYLLLTEIPGTDGALTRSEVRFSVR